MSEEPTRKKKTPKASVHRRPQCGFSIDLKDLDLPGGTTGFVTCPKCDWSAPINIEIVDGSCANARPSRDVQGPGMNGKVILVTAVPPKPGFAELQLAELAPIIEARRQFAGYSPHFSSWLPAILPHHLHLISALGMRPGLTIPVRVETLPSAPIRQHRKGTSSGKASTCAPSADMPSTSSSWVLFERRLHPPVYDAVMQQAESRGIVPAKLQHVTQPEEAFAFVKGSYLAFVVKAGAIRVARNGVTARPLAEEALTLKMYLVSLADNRSKVTGELVRTFMKKLSGVERASQVKLRLSV